MNPAEPWSARLEIRLEDAEAAERLYRVLLPESSREVPRTEVRLNPPTDRSLAIDLLAKDSGALRAALQTYLGWIQLTQATLEAGRSDARSPT
jgi:tRNA threonylcarbamoyladenosine modification (KEOPS) complex  Pcc1 subunit